LAVAVGDRWQVEEHRQDAAVVTFTFTRERGESWSDCSEHLVRLSEQEPRLRSKLVSDTEAEGMLDGHAICTSAADPDGVIIAVRMGLFRSGDQGKTWQDLRVDTRAPQAWRQGQTITLTPSTHKLLLCLMRAAPGVVRKQEMEYLLWGDHPPESGALRTHIHELRQHADKSFTYPLIETVHGIGWRLSAPTTSVPE